MADPSIIRANLKRRLGDERYAKFVSRLPAPGGRGRMMFWQEREWEKFVAEYPNCSLNVSEVISVFAECPEYGANIRRANYLAHVTTWLTERITVGQIEKKYGKRCGWGSWGELEKQFEDGDEFYEYRSPPETWQQLRGRAGIALVKGGKVVDLIVTSLN